MRIEIQESYMNFLNIEENKYFKVEKGWLVNVFTHERLCKIMPPNKRPISTLIQQEIKHYKTGVSVSFSDKGLFIKKFMLNNGKYLYKFAVPYNYRNNHIYSIIDLASEFGVLLRFDCLNTIHYVYKTYNSQVFESNSFDEINKIATKLENSKQQYIKSQLSDVSSLTHEMLDK